MAEARLTATSLKRPLVPTGGPSPMRYYVQFDLPGPAGNSWPKFEGAQVFAPVPIEALHNVAGKGGSPSSTAECLHAPVAHSIAPSRVAGARRVDLPLQPAPGRWGSLPARRARPGHRLACGGTACLEPRRSGLLGHRRRRAAHRRSGLRVRSRIGARLGARPARDRRALARGRAGARRRDLAGRAPRDPAVRRLSCRRRHLAQSLVRRRGLRGTATAPRPARAGGPSCSPTRTQ